MFIDGFLALCSAVGTGTCTEMTTPGYARAPISFGRPASGTSMLSSPFSFGTAGALATLAGRAVYDAPVGGNLLLVLPLPVPRAALGLAFETRDVGGIVLHFDLLAGLPNGDAFTGLLPASATVGYTYDVADKVGVFNSADSVPAGITAIPMGAGQFLYVKAAPITVGPGALAISRGILQLQTTARSIA